LMTEFNQPVTIWMCRHRKRLCSKILIISSITYIHDCSVTRFCDVT